MKLDWRKIWKEFGNWCDSRIGAPEEYPEWPDQKRAIQRIINKHIQRIEKLTKMV